MQIKKQQLELDMEQRTGPKLGKEYFKAVYCHPAYLTSMQSKSCEMPSWMNHIATRNINNLRYADDTTLIAESKEELKSLLMKEESGKAGLQLNILAFSHHFMANRWEKSGNSDRFYFLGLQNHCRW